MSNRLYYFGTELQTIEAANFNNSRKFYWQKAFVLVFSVYLEVQIGWFLALLVIKRQPLYVLMNIRQWEKLINKYLCWTNKKINSIRCRIKAGKHFFLNLKGKIFLKDFYMKFACWLIKHNLVSILRINSGWFLFIRFCHIKHTPLEWIHISSSILFRNKEYFSTISFIQY